MEHYVTYLPDADIDATLQARLDELSRAGTRPNTLRAYERDLAYISAWKRLTFGRDLEWPESEAVALRFIVDHSESLADKPTRHPPRRVAEALVAAKLRRSLDRPAPATLDRRIASWRKFHNQRRVESPFASASVREARRNARRAIGHRPPPKAAKPITIDVLEAILAACPTTLGGMRDRALLETAWASGGRRRSEIAALHHDDLCLDHFDTKGIVRLRLIQTKTTDAGQVPTLALSGRAARHLVAWLDAAQIKAGPVFRAVSKSDRPLERGLTDSGVRDVIRAALRRAGFAKGFTSAHGLRSGFLTQAARDGVSMQAAVRLSLHRSIEQASRYYQDAELEDNPALGLLDRRR